MLDKDLKIGDDVLCQADIDTYYDLENRKRVKSEGFNFDWENKRWIKFMSEDEFLFFDKFDIKQIEFVKKEEK